MYELLISPAEEPIDLAELKHLLRVDHDQDDALITSLQQTARTYIERRYDLALLSQTWRATFTSDASAYALRPSVLQSVSSVTLVRDGAEIVLDTDQWELCRGRPSHLELTSVSLASADIIRIDFVSGYGSRGVLPADLVRAVALLTAHYYEERELFRAQRYVPVPHSVDALVQPYREIHL